jgi:hypothetical protein
VKAMGSCVVPAKLDADGLPSSADRHRGGGYPPTPATPPYVRVRIRRFEKLRRYSSTSEGRPSDLK